MAIYIFASLCLVGLFEPTATSKSLVPDDARDPCAYVQCGPIECDGSFLLRFVDECCPQCLVDCSSRDPCPELDCPPEDQVCLDEDDPCSCTICKDDIDSSQCPPVNDELCLDDDAVSECETDDHCKGNKICCPGLCAKECVPPSGRSGPPLPRNIDSNQCPPVNEGPCLDDDVVSECETDDHCEGNKICCPGLCAKECVPPSGRSGPPLPRIDVDSKRCPPLNDEPCLDDDVVSECETDEHCKGNKLCCPGLCAKECVPRSGLSGPPLPQIKKEDSVVSSRKKKQQEEVQTVRESHLKAWN